MFLQPDLSGALFLYFFSPETSGLKKYRKKRPETSGGGRNSCPNKKIKK
jgi:hypothetical protein